MLTAKNQQQLRIMRDIFEVSNRCRTKTYIWAGLVQDVLAGSFLREHGDVDGFVLNLWVLKDEMAGLYRQRGYRVSWIEGVDFMKIEDGEMHAVFNQLEVAGDTALWRHAGIEGTLYFPKQWLSDTPCRFYDTSVFVSGVEFEYAIKMSPGLLSPLWKSREKDAAALRWLNGVLDEMGLEREEILRQVWSYNPFWLKQGYKEYALPAVASTLAPIDRRRTG